MVRRWHLIRMYVYLETEVQYLKGVGPKLGSALNRRGIETVQDLIEYIPRAYESRRHAIQISDLKEGEVVSLKAQIISLQTFSIGQRKQKVHEVIIKDETGRIRLKYFRLPYRGYFQKFSVQQIVRVTGKVINYRGQLEFHHPDLQDINEVKTSAQSADNQDQLIPIYTETDGLNSAKIAALIQKAFASLIPQGGSLREGPPLKPEQLGLVLLDKLPSWLKEKYGLISRLQALRWVHQPEILQASEYQNFRSSAHRRLIFEEFFWHELYLLSKKATVQKHKAPIFRAEEKSIDKFKQLLPFQLTQAQQRAFSEIQADFALGRPMQRLVQGDVGSGKTMVAFLAIVQAAANGFQTSLMVPTEILAEQHYKSALRQLQPLGIKVALLIGKMKSQEKQIVISDLQKGYIDVLIGTQALIQEGVDFHRLGLIIIDEQHRFGVLQRGFLKEKGRSPHFLVMTATPIPRTLAMTVYGDLDVSVIDELPAGRQPIVTRVTHTGQREKIWSFLQSQVAAGRQAYVIYPLVEESEKLDLKDAVSQYKLMCESMPTLRFGLLHGKMKSSEKEEVMRSFREHKFDVLVSTTVVEVGVDVPNANLMIVEHAERFGLSQLHQLRGRVGRGTHKSYCVLVSAGRPSDAAKFRLDIMEKNTDGFKIAEADLELRGPGEFLGEKQSGLAGFKVANIVRDKELLEEARNAALAVIAKDADLIQSEHALMRAELVKVHGPLFMASIA